MLPACAGATVVMSAPPKRSSQRLTAAGEKRHINDAFRAHGRTLHCPVPAGRAVATAASSAAQPAERGWGGQPAAGCPALVGLIRCSLCLDTFSHCYPETTVAATALPLPYGGFCKTGVSNIWVFWEGLQGNTVTSEVL